MARNSQINEIITAINTYLFSKEEIRLKKLELEAVRKNKEASNLVSDGFFYQGLFYTDLNKSVSSKGIKENLHSSLVPFMEKLIKDKKQINFDKDRIKQALSIILIDCKNYQDVRDALPNQLTDVLEHTKRLERTRPEGFTIKDDPRKVKQYEMLREKIEFYSITRMIYWGVLWNIVITLIQKQLNINMQF